MKKVIIEGYGSVKRAELNLTPFHALIGPNDSGKTTLLKALALTGLMSHDWRIGGTSYTAPAQKSGLIVSDSPRCRISWGNTGDFPGTVRLVIEGSQFSQPWEAYESASPIHPGLVRFVSWDPSAMRAPSHLIDNDAKFTAGRGAGLPGVLMNIMTRGDEAFLEIRDRFCRLFPTWKRVGVRPRSSQSLEIYGELEDGTIVPPEQISEGVLYYLGFEVLRFLRKTDLLLLEEPENGLHPARIREVVNVLRRFAEEMNTQVVMSTHSPLVINEMEPHEVSLVTRTPEDGTRVTLMKDTPNFDKRSKIYALGELWLAYADGNTDTLAEPKDV